MGTFIAANAGGVDELNDVTFSPFDGHALCTSYGGNSVLRYNGATGAYMDTFIAAGSGGLSGPTQLQFANGNLYVVALGAGRSTFAVVCLINVYFLFLQVLEYNGQTGAFIKQFLTRSGVRGIVFGRLFWSNKKSR